MRFTYLSIGQQLAKHSSNWNNLTVECYSLPSLLDWLQLCPLPSLYRNVEHNAAVREIRVCVFRYVHR